MSTATVAETNRQQPSRPAAPQRSAGISGRPRNPGRLALAVLLVVGGGLLFVSLYSSRGTQEPTLVLARDVAAGQVLTDADLAVVDVAADSLALVPATERADLFVGSPPVAQVALKKGSLLMRSQLGAATPVPAGSGLVVVTLPADAVPAGLRAELPVLVVAKTESYPGVVHEVRSPSSQSATSNYGVTLRMDLAAAQLIAVAKDVRLIVLPSSPSSLSSPSTTTITAPAAAPNVSAPIATTVAPAPAPAPTEPAPAPAPTEPAPAPAPSEGS